MVAYRLFLQRRRSTSPLLLRRYQAILLNFRLISAIRQVQSWHKGEYFGLMNQRGPYGVVQYDKLPRL